LFKDRLKTMLGGSSTQGTTATGVKQAGSLVQATGPTTTRQSSGLEQFVSTKKQCNESIAGLVFERFAEKLIKNRDDLMAKTGCREVRFTVYVKDGKAALKATPVKDE